MLVLNASYEPINVCTVRRAAVLILKNRAEILEQGDWALHAESLTLARPVVIRLLTYVRIPRDAHRRKITRRAVFARDRWTCQYCGHERGNLTVDHVIPRSKGGSSTWDNIVTCCAPCNRRKGDRLPAPGQHGPGAHAAGPEPHDLHPRGHAEHPRGVGAVPGGGVNEERAAGVSTRPGQPLADAAQPPPLAARGRRLGRGRHRDRRDRPDRGQRGRHQRAGRQSARTAGQISALQRELEDRIDELEGRIDELPQAEDVTNLDQRLRQVEDGAGDTADQLAELTTSLEELETRGRGARAGAGARTRRRPDRPPSLLQWQDQGKEVVRS